MTDARDRSIWALIGTVTLVAAAVEWFLVVPDADHSRSWPLVWPVVVAVGFLLAELLVVHLRIGGEAFAFSLMEIPLVLGLFFVRPDLLVACRLVGALAAFVWERRSAQKAAFNCSLFALETAGAVAIWNAVAHTSDALSPRAWLATGLAVLFTSMVSSTLVSTAITIATGALPSSLSEVYGLGQLGDLANACFALVAVFVLQAEWRASWLLLVVTGVLVVAYRAFEAARLRAESLEHVNRFTEEIGREVDLVQVIGNVLLRVRAGFECRLVELRWTSGTGTTEDWVLQDDAPERLPARLADVLADHVGGPDGLGALAVPRTTRQPQLVAALRAGRVRDCLVVPLHREGAVVGSIVVADRLGDTSTFGAADLSQLQALANHAAVAIENAGRAQELIRQAEEREHQAMHDELTGLANRRRFGSTLATTLEQEAATVLLLDLDRFAQVNNNLGHEIGDRLLCLVARRLVEATPPRAVLARFGGDEFAVLLPGADDASARACASAVQDALARPFDLEGVALGIGVSIGVAVAGRRADPVGVLRWADLALYSAKETRVGLDVYRPELDREDGSKLGLLADLREAIVAEELAVHYQPQVDIRTGDVVGVEALVRWQHPRHGFLPPDEFVPLAEHSSLITPLTRLVLRTALADLSAWTDTCPLSVAVNVSPRSLLDPDFVDLVADALDTAGVAASDLTLEITETSLMSDPERGIEALTRLRELGVRLSIDDLGTGYSSLAYLQRLPVHEVKIDRSFVAAFPDEAAHAVVGAIVDLAHRLDRCVVAEGVEDAPTMEALHGLGCDVAQGYHLARPMPAEKMTEFLADRYGVRPQPLRSVR